MRNSNASSKSEENLLKLHMAEYSALMNRCTTFIAIHIGLWSVIVAVAAFATSSWFAAADPAHPDPARQVKLLWLGAAAIQALLHIWVTLIEEQYLTVSYIENNLRDSIVRLLPPIPANGFWQYEIFLERGRLRESWWGEWIMPVVLFILFAIVVSWRWQSIMQELPFAIMNFVSILVLSIRTYYRIKLRRSFARNVMRMSVPSTD